MSTAQEKWASWSPRERDAWVAVHVMGWTETGIWDAWDANKDQPEPLPITDDDYFGCPPNASKDFRDGKRKSTFEPLPHYTTDAAADYLVLKHVRETWDRNSYQFAMFDEELYDLWNNRCGRCGTWEPAEYLPGDYSTCASLVLMESQQEQSDADSSA